MSGNHKQSGSQGSVRRARERIEGGGLSHPTPVRQPPPVPAAFKCHEQGSRGAIISRPTPIPKWPLQEREEARNEAVQENIPWWARGPAPQRPARPSNVPSILDSSKVQEYAPSMPYNPASGQEEASTPDSDVFPTPGRPLTASSSGTVPDFLLQHNNVTQQGAGRKPSNIGPPPSGRRGNSSFYSTNSFVSPIPEESPEPSPRAVKSFASSKVIPSSWGSAPRDSEIVKMYEDMPENPPYNRPPSPQEEEVSLVRQASLGRRGKPSLRTLSKAQGDSNNSETGSAGAKSPTQSTQTTPATQTTQAPRSPIAANANTAALKPSGLRKEVEIPSHPQHERSYSSSSDSSIDDLEKPPIPVSMLDHPSLKELEMDELNSMNQRKIDARRPPRLNIDAVREAEARGSLTSLPDLIRRATRVAHNLDNGKTASKMGLMDILNASGDNKRPRRHSGSISDILASFPPPGVATPDGPRHRANPAVTFPSEYDAHDQEKQVRRCCGIRRSVFILVILLLIIIIAAAVLIPVFLIVLPRQQESNSTQANDLSLDADSCEAIQPCKNGGISIGSKDSCSCVCVNGFRGSDCAIPGDSSCTTLDISDDSNDFNNATIGSALPRLFESAESDFNIPLDASKIVKLFNAEDVSCTSENAIVTFNGANRKRGVSPHSEHFLRKHPGHKRPSIVVRNEELEVIDNTIPTPTKSPTATPTSTSTSIPTLSAETLDFARIAVLYMFEQAGDFSDTVTAQEKIQRFLRGAEKSASSEGGNDAMMEYLAKPQDISVDEVEFRLNFADFTIDMGGNVVGGGK